MEIKLDVRYESGLGLENIIPKDILVKEYIRIYEEIKFKYSEFYREGTGYKTNRYHEPVMNKAYNYIEHNDFLKTAKESVSGYDENNRPKGNLIEYSYYESVWSRTCDELCKLYNNQFTLKLDHRYKDRKNNDFDGTLICYKNKKFWQDRNLPNKQRY